MGRDRLVTAVAALVVLAGLAGCSSTKWAPGAEPGGTADAEEPAAGQETTVDPLPSGDLGEVAVLPQPRYDSEYGDEPIGAVYTDDLVVFGETRHFLRAVDRETGRTVWRVPMRDTQARTGGDTMCDIALPDDDPEVVVLNHGGGEACGNFTVYRLTDGKIVDQYRSVSAEGKSIGFALPVNSNLVQVGGTTYYVDADEFLQRLGASGEPETVASLPSLAGASSGMNVSRFQLIAGTDVLVARLEPGGGDAEGLFEEQENGLLLGLRVEDDEAELLWTQRVSDLISPAVSPNHEKGSFYFSDAWPGVVGDFYRDGGPRVLRVRAIDPETGELGRRAIEVPYREGVDVPAFTDEFRQSQVLTTAAGVTTPVRPGDFDEFSTIVHYDLETGRPSWTWTIPHVRKALSVESDVIGETPDETGIYVEVTVDFDTTLYRFDAETGDVIDRWPLPLRGKAVYDLDAPLLAIDDGDVLAVGTTGYPGTKTLAALFTVEE